jgi:hypothetical protein
MVRATLGPLRTKVAETRSPPRSMAPPYCGGTFRLLVPNRTEQAVAKPVKHYGRWRIRWVDENGARKSEVYDDYRAAAHKLREHEVRRGLLTLIFTFVVCLRATRRAPLCISVDRPSRTTNVWDELRHTNLARIYSAELLGSDGGSMKDPAQVLLEMELVKGGFMQDLIERSKNSGEWAPVHHVVDLVASRAFVRIATLCCAAARPRLCGEGRRTPRFAVLAAVQLGALERSPRRAAFRPHLPVNETAVALLGTSRGACSSLAHGQGPCRKPPKLGNAKRWRK